MVSGEEQVLGAIRNRKACLVIIATDASENTMKKVTEKARYYRIPCIAVGDRYKLGHAIGKGERVLLAVTDRGFAKGLMRYEGVTYLGVD